MRKTLLISATAAAIALGFSGTANAGVSSLLTDGVNTFDDLSGDFLLRANGGGTGNSTNFGTGFDEVHLLGGGGEVIAAGDLIATVFEIENVNGMSVTGNTGQELTGLFLAKATTVTDFGGAFGTADFGVPTAAEWLSIFGLDVTAGPFSGLGAVPMLIFWDDGSPDLDLFSDTVAAAIADAQDGALGGAFTDTDGAGGTDFFTYTGNLDAAAIATAIPGFQGGTFNSLLSPQIWNFLGTPVGQIFTSGSILAPNSIATPGFPIEDNIEGNITLVPEPTTTAMFGFGLLGLGALARRRRKA